MHPITVDMVEGEGARSSTKGQAVSKTVTGAMIYPTVLLLGCVVLLFVFSTVLMPKLSQLISKTGGELPAITQVLINFSDFMVDWWRIRL